MINEDVYLVLSAAYGTAVWNKTRSMRLAGVRGRPDCPVTCISLDAKGIKKLLTMSERKKDIVMSFKNGLSH